MFPIRCLTCGKVVANKEKQYIEGIKTKPIGDVLDELKMFRYCCRRMFLGHDFTLMQRMLDANYNANTN
jgi:DNA-directed RNA polymerase I, II, and III subunit RPABC5